MIYRVSGPARRDLREIWRHTDTKWGTEQADAYIDTLIARCAWLTMHVGLWRERDDVQPGLFSYVQGSHVLLFRSGDDVIENVRVLHKRMDVEKHL